MSHRRAKKMRRQRKAKCPKRKPTTPIFIDDAPPLMSRSTEQLLYQLSPRKEVPNG